MLLHRKPSSHRLSRISLDYLLLPPRSVLMHDREKITLCLLHIILPIKGRKNASHQLTNQQILFDSFVGCRLYVFTLVAPLIFKAIAFVRWVFTHSLTDSNFHGHCPNVLIQQHFLWYLIMSVKSGTFKTLLSVHPASPILLTKKRSTKKKKYSWRRNVFIQFIPPITPI